MRSCGSPATAFLRGLALNVSAAFEVSASISTFLPTSGFADATLVALYKANATAPPTAAT